MKAIKNECLGSRTFPAEIITEADLNPDRWGNLCGSAGKGRCGICGRIIGLSSLGKMSIHATHTAASEQAAEQAI